MIMASTKDELKRTAYTLNNTDIKYNLKIQANKTKGMTMKRKMSMRTKIVIK
jgi:hypothetical protein